MAPEDFLDERQRVYERFGTALHDAAYRGHVGVGEGPSKFFQGLFEFSNRMEQLELSEG